VAAFHPGISYFCLDQLHVVRSLISENPKLMNALDVVQPSLPFQSNSSDLYMYRMSGQLFTGLHLPDLSTLSASSLTNRLKWILWTTAGGHLFTLQVEKTLVLPYFD
jgi:hypothetical protein